MGYLKLDVEQHRQIAADYAAGETVAALAIRYGVIDVTARRAIQRMGVVTRGRTAHNRVHVDVDEVVCRYRAGESQQAIADSIGVSQIVISRRLFERGVSRRPQNPRGAAHGSWKGGRVRNRLGYVEIRLDRDDPFFPMVHLGGYVLEHRLVMAKALGRNLEPHETVHHLNGVRDDNRLDNLQLRQGRHGAGVRMVCNACGSRDVRAVRLD